MPMGRPRTTRKDLPPGLYVDRWGTYFYRATRGGERRYIVIGKVNRDEAIVLLGPLSRRIKSLHLFDATQRIVPEILIRRGERAQMPAPTCPDQAMGRDDPQMRSRLAHRSIGDLQRLSLPDCL